MKNRFGVAQRRGRVLRLSRGASIVLALPLAMALAVTTVVAMIVGIATVVVAPALRRRPIERRRRTITLERSAYRPVEGADTGREGALIASPRQPPRHD